MGRQPRHTRRYSVTLQSSLYQAFGLEVTVAPPLLTADGAVDWISGILWQLKALRMNMLEGPYRGTTGYHRMAFSLSLFRYGLV